MGKGLSSLGEQELEAGFAASHPLPSLPIYAAPSTRDDFKTSNKLKLSLNPIACWRLDDARFEFDSSFVMPDASKELAVLIKMIKLQPDAPLSVFGHTDPVGKDDYNIVLGGRRARSIHCVLTRDVPGWLELYDHAFGGDNWKAKKIEGVMLGALGFSSSVDDIKAFQSEQGLDPDGSIGKDTRKALIKAYLEFLFPMVLTKAAFLGAGKDPKHKGDFQSCGEFNPILLLSADENKKLPHAKRDVENSLNRRVVVYFFEPGLEIQADKWPCPAAPLKQGDAAAAITTCKKRFWSDSDDRRAPAQDARRAFKETHDTWGCRFYHRTAGWSPCEGGQVVKHWVIRLVTTDGAPPPSEGKPLANEPFIATLDGGGSRRAVGTTDDAGVLRVRVHADTTQLVVKLGDLELKFDGGALKSLEETTEEPVKQRLYNLGYGAGDWAQWTDEEFKASLAQFQKNESVSKSDPRPALTDTRKKLLKAHDTLPGAGDDEPAQAST